jgi:hypothetical protein
LVVVLVLEEDGAFPLDFIVFKRNGGAELAPDIIFIVAIKLKINY